MSPLPSFVLTVKKVSKSPILISKGDNGHVWFDEKPYLFMIEQTNVLQDNATEQFG